MALIRSLSALLLIAICTGCATSETALPNPDAAVNDNAGFSVAISGDVLVSGVARNDDLGPNAGKSLFYRRTAGVWDIGETVFPSMPATGGGFGWSASVDNDRAVIGAFTELNAIGTFISGSAYIFEWNGSTWNLSTRVTGEPTLPEDGFGNAVSISGNYVAVGAPLAPPPTFIGTGAVYVFARNASGEWIQDAILTPADGANNDDFGHSVSVNGERLLIGARFDDDDGSSSGSAYLFRRESGGTWVQEAKLNAFDAQTGDHFGSSVGLSGNVAIIGAEDEDTNGVDAGAAYVFERDLETNDWMPTAKLLAFDGTSTDEFGKSVAVDGNGIIVGAWLAPLTPDVAAGAAYFYRRNAGSWQSVRKLIPDTGAYGDGFGFSVGISGDCAAVGAVNQHSSGGADTGATYAFCDLPLAQFVPIEIDIICCVQRPDFDPTGPVVMTLRITTRGQRTAIMERWVEIQSPDGQVRSIRDSERITLSPDQVSEETLVVPLGPNAPQGEYTLIVYSRLDSGIIGIHRETFTR